MDRTGRHYKIDRMLNDRKVLPITEFLEEMDISMATFKRDVEYLRDRFNTPIA